MKRIATRVEERLIAFFSEIEGADNRLFETCSHTPLLAQIRDLTLRGGKRLRAGLLVNGAGLFIPDAETCPPVIDAAAAMELRQTYLLIHDDIMDGDAVRRGGPSVHVALAGYVNDARLGVNLGIAAGDLAAALEQILLSRIDMDEPSLVRLHRVFAAMHMAVVQGQALDLMGEVSAFEVALHKTASYTTVGPLAAGAALAGARERDVEHLARIAQPLGIAFQFRDDLLGTFGNPERTGKPVDGDLLEGKPTVLLEETLARADRFQKKRVESIVGNREATPEELGEVREVMVQCGAKAVCERHVAELTREFISGLDREYYRPKARKFLIDLAQFIGERET